jgi:HTH-type transcriptional regulator/antitoxin HigA
MEKMIMLQTKELRNLEQTARFVFVPTNEIEYRHLVGILDEIIDLVRDDENHPLAGWMDVMGVLIETYENEHVP